MPPAKAAETPAVDPAKDAEALGLVEEAAGKPLTDDAHEVVDDVEELLSDAQRFVADAKVRIAQALAPLDVIAAAGMPHVKSMKSAIETAFAEMLDHFVNHDRPAEQDPDAPPLYTDADGNPIERPEDEAPQATGPHHIA